MSSIDKWLHGLDDSLENYDGEEGKSFFKDDVIQTPVKAADSRADEYFPKKTFNQPIQAVASSSVSGSPSVSSAESATGFKKYSIVTGNTHLDIVDPDGVPVPPEERRNLEAA